MDDIKQLERLAALKSEIADLRAFIFKVGRERNPSPDKLMKQLRAQNRVDGPGGLFDQLRELEFELGVEA